jgi:protein-S-isoprenylcysteine O-methyltransferase Ste14
MARRLLVLGYGVVAYGLFVAVFGYAVCFLAGVGVPKGIDDGAPVPAWLAVTADCGFLLLFALQHSVMARPWFKRWWTRLVPPVAERSTYVVASSLVLGLLMWLWRPLPDPVWSMPAGWPRIVLWVLYAAGWVLVLVSTFAIDHFDLFGLRQVIARARERRYAAPRLRTPLLYRLVRHPLMVGFLVVFWAAPGMSVGRLLFAAVSTGYILVGIRFEERDLKAQLGEGYRHYLTDVPRFLPRVPLRRSAKVTSGRRNANRTMERTTCGHGSRTTKASSNTTE